MVNKQLMQLLGFLLGASGAGGIAVTRQLNKSFITNRRGSPGTTLRNTYNTPIGRKSTPKSLNGKNWYQFRQSPGGVAGYSQVNVPGGQATPKGNFIPVDDIIEEINVSSSYAIAAANVIRIEALTAQSTAISALITDSTEPHYLQMVRNYTFLAQTGVPISVTPFFMLGENGMSFANADSNNTANINNQVDALITGAHKLVFGKQIVLPLKWVNGNLYRQGNLSINLTALANEYTRKAVLADAQDRAFPVLQMGFIFHGPTGALSISMYGRYRTQYRLRPRSASI